LQPLFFVEILFRLSPADADLKTLGDRTSDTYDVITSKVLVLRSLPRGTFTELQQAAAFEYVLDYVSNHQNALTQSGSYIWENFRQFAETGDETKFPIDYRYVRYPTPLLQWYSKAIEEKRLVLESEEHQNMVLKQRAALRSKGVKTLPDFDSEFRAFHFRDIQGRMLRFKDMNGGVLIRYACRCMKYNNKIGELPLEYLKYMNSCVEAGFELAEQDQVSWHKKYLEKMEHDGTMAQLEKKSKWLALEDSNLHIQEEDDEKELPLYHEVKFRVQSLLDGSLRIMQG
jgi:hypothetical protein